MGSNATRLLRGVILGLTALTVSSSAIIADDNDNDHRFLLGGTAQKAQDPENYANDVIRIDTTTPIGQCAPPDFLNCPRGTVSRSLNVKIDKLDHMLEFKSYFVAPKTCNAGIPRLTLLIDADGDGDFQQTSPEFPTSPDFAAHGHVQPFTPCPPNTWKYDDLTDNLPRWEITPGTSAGVLGLPTFPFALWDTFETAVNRVFPNHNVCSGFLIDANETSPGQQGIAYYDVITIGRATYANHRDIAGRGSVPGCGRRHGDRDHDDDDDDGKHDDEDSDDDGDGRHDDDDSDDDNDDIDDRDDSSSEEVQAKAEDVVGPGQSKTYDISADANSLLLMAIAESAEPDLLNQPLVVEILTSTGMVVAQSPPVPGRAIATAVPIPGSYKIRIRNTGFKTVTYTTAQIVRRNWIF